MWTTDWLDMHGVRNLNLVLGDNSSDRLHHDRDEGCFTGIKITMTDILLNNVNGVDVSIAPTEFYLACSVVAQRQMLIESPPNIRENFDK